MPTFIFLIFFLWFVDLWLDLCDVIGKNDEAICVDCVVASRCQGVEAVHDVIFFKPSQDWV